MPVKWRTCNSHWFQYHMSASPTQLDRHDFENEPSRMRIRNPTAFCSRWIRHPPRPTRDDFRACRPERTNVLGLPPCQSRQCAKKKRHNKHITLFAHHDLLRTTYRSQPHDPSQELVSAEDPFQNTSPEACCTRVYPHCTSGSQSSPKPLISRLSCGLTATHCLHRNWHRERTPVTLCSHQKLNYRWH